MTKEQRIRFKELKKKRQQAKFLSNEESAELDSLYDLATAENCKKIKIYIGFSCIAAILCLIFLLV